MTGTYYLHENGAYSYSTETTKQRIVSSPVQREVSRSEVEDGLAKEAETAAKEAAEANEKYAKDKTKALKKIAEKTGLDLADLQFL